MKKVKLFSKMSDFEEFINRADMDIIQVDIKVVEQSLMFQESFAAVVFYKEYTSEAETYEENKLGGLGGFFSHGMRRINKLIDELCTTIEKEIHQDLSEAEKILAKHIDKESMDGLSVNVWPDMLDAMEEYVKLKKDNTPDAKHLLIDFCEVYATGYFEDPDDIEGIVDWYLKVKDNFMDFNM